MAAPAGCSPLWVHRPGLILIPDCALVNPKAVGQPYVIAPPDLGIQDILVDYGTSVAAGETLYNLSPAQHMVIECHA